MNKLSLELYTPEVITKIATNATYPIMDIVYKDKPTEFKEAMKPHMYELVYPGLDVNISYSTDESETIDTVLKNTMAQVLHELQGTTCTVFNATTVGEINQYLAMLEVYNTSTPTINTSSTMSGSEWEFNPDCIMPNGEYNPSYADNSYSASVITLSEWFAGTVFAKPLTFTVPKQ
jgi:hypothetical protein